MTKKPAGEEKRKHKKKPHHRKKKKPSRKKKKFLQRLGKDCKTNIVGEKGDLPVHFCYKCGLPIKIYGRIIPCKHAFCCDCVTLSQKKGDKICPGCSNPVLRIEKYTQGSIYMCSTVPGCKRTYLSQRDLQAHINHRHKRAGKRVTRARVRSRIAPLPTKIPVTSKTLLDKDHKSHIPSEKRTTMPPPPVQHVARKYYDQPREDTDAPPAESYTYSPNLVHKKNIRISSLEYRNLIIVPTQDDSNSGTKEPSPPAPAPAYYHPGYQSQAVVPSHSHQIRLPEQQYVPLPAPPTYPMSYFPENAGTPYLVCNQRLPWPMTSDPSQITSYLQYINAMVPPYMNSPSIFPYSGDPSVSAFPLYYYNFNSLPQLNEDQLTLSLPYIQADGISPGIWSSLNVLSPYSPSRFSGSRRSNWRRYRPY